MSTKYNLIECSLCGIGMGFNFTDEPTPKQYCYPCGHSILLIKSQLSNCVDFTKIPDYTLAQYRNVDHLESAVVYHLTKLKDK